MAYSWSAGGFRRERRLAALAGALAVSLAHAAATAPAAAQVPPPYDRAAALIRAVAPPTSDGGGGEWAYYQALFLYGQHLVYKRTRDPSYLRHLKEWGNAKIAADGTPAIPERGKLKPGARCNKEGKPDSVNANALDFLNPGRMAVILYQETKQRKYLLAARKIRAQFDIYPKTGSGAFLHTCNSAGIIWADGAYMSVSFLLAYAEAFPSEAAAARRLAAEQLVAYGGHLQQASGLLRHGFDESPNRNKPLPPPWPWKRDVYHPKTGLSPEVWCRAVGWYGVALVDTLAALPKTHGLRPELLARLRNLALGLERSQDRVTGRWRQVIDRAPWVPVRVGSKTVKLENWLETSCSAMHAYTLSRAAQRGWVGQRFRAVADNAFRGVLDMVSDRPAADGTATIEGTVQGTSEGNLAYYLTEVKTQDNNLHGIGAFLIMHEHVVDLPAPARR